ncbi:ExeA family protein [Anoxybacillus sp. J5B_2022]|uniref:ExeA family protein n=1 Tax=Anoxybacillus sp. J5B_2022 TaxID=3003246 RepID=UPI00228678BD|nr:AAA family ATPase [Anoxybacillus sp. J5B_2022]MCZ0757109.1 AAA family ATPase [Anoxybacillus sp. J5B_2022]
MYKTFYSLSREPFSKDTNPSEAYRGSSYEEALHALDYVKRTKGIGLLTGEPGAGKTFALRTFKESLNPSLYHVVYFPLSTGGVMDFYRGLALGLGEEPKYRKVDLFYQIQQGIERMDQERRITPVILLDEMHLAKDAFLQDIAILFNFHMDSTNPFVLILAGLPHLQIRLRLNHHRPLQQRIIMRYRMGALSKEEVAAYIEQRMKQAGAKHSIFTPAALEAIALQSQGWPRVINTLTTTCLLYGYQLKKDVIDEEIVRMAVEETGA